MNQESETHTKPYVSTMNVTNSKQNFTRGPPTSIPLQKDYFIVIICMFLYENRPYWRLYLNRSFTN